MCDQMMSVDLKNLGQPNMHRDLVPHSTPPGRFEIWGHLDATHMPPLWGYLRAVKEMTKNTTLLVKQNQLHSPTALQTPAIRGVKFPPQPSAFSGQAAFAA